MTSHRERLVRFYARYQPDKLSSVDELLAKSAGKEEKLFAKLVEKYGPEPEEEIAATSSTDADAKKKSAEGTSKNTKPGGKQTGAVDEEPAPPAPVVKNADTWGEDPKAAAKKKREEQKKQQQRRRDDEEEEEEEDDDGYGTRPWWKARIVRFYRKYAPEKESSVDGLLDKANDDPNKLMKLIAMLEQKYGPEPDPSSDEEEEEEEEEEDEKEEEKHREDHGNAKNEEEEEEEEDEDEHGPLRRPVYCPIDGVPPEYSEYFPDTFSQALPWLAAKFPDLKLATQGGVTAAEYALAQGVQAMDLAAADKAGKSEKAGARSRGGAKKSKSKSAEDNKVVIEVNKRNKRKFLTAVRGLETAAGVKLKDAAKALGKKFASGVGVKAGADGGGEYVEMQGDFTDTLPEALLELFPALTKDAIMLVDEDGKKVKAF